MKDAIGNDLKVGDLVAIQLARPLIYGRVTEISEGGIITGIRGGKQEIRPTRILVVSNHPIEVHPHQPLITELVCLRDESAPLLEARPEVGEGDKPN